MWHLAISVAGLSMLISAFRGPFAIKSSKGGRFRFGRVMPSTTFEVTGCGSIVIAGERENTHEAVFASRANMLPKGKDKVFTDVLAATGPTFAVFGRKLTLL